MPVAAFVRIQNPVFGNERISWPLPEAQSERPLSWCTRFNSLANRLLELILLRSSSWMVPLVILGGCICSGVETSERQQDLIRWIDQRELLREAKLAGYTVTEYYTITNSRFSRPAARSRSSGCLRRWNLAA